MSDFPRQENLPDVIDTWSRYSAMRPLSRYAANVAPAAGNATANRAIFVPIFLPWRYEIRRMFLTHGSNATGNFDLGVYDGEGRRIWSSGSVAKSGTWITQHVTPASPILLDAARYYLAYASDAAFFHGRGSGDLPDLAAVNVLQLDSAFPLPADMTGAVAPTQFVWPFMGITNRSQ